jgi:hypothetical protein
MHQACQRWIQPYGQDHMISPVIRFGGTADYLDRRQTNQPEQ